MKLYTEIEKVFAVVEDILTDDEISGFLKTPTGNFIYIIFVSGHGSATI